MLGLHCCKWPFSVVAESGLLSSWSVPASHCSDFCLCFSKFLLIYYLFIFVAALGLFRCMWTSSGCSSWGLLSRCRARASHCSGFSCGAGTRGAGRHSSRGARAQLLCGTWGLPGPGIRSMPPALAGRFFTSRPPGESLASLVSELQSLRAASVLAALGLGSCGSRGQVTFNLFLCLSFSVSSLEITHRVDVRIN